ncbi:hypothetical protein ScPMuIL_012422 [Solemya velum]
MAKVSPTPDLVKETMNTIEMTTDEGDGRRKSVHYHDIAISADNVGSAPTIFSNDEAKWIQRYVKMRCCTAFVEKPRDLPAEVIPDAMCFCGYPKSQHENINRRFRGMGKWSKESNTTAATTNAFGEIEFVGYGGNIGKYVRVDVDSEIETIQKLMMKVWGLEKPNLLISVTGGAKNFRLKLRLKEVFRRGLMKVAQSTGAWIVTGGTNTGVMKHVGEAVRDYGLTSTTTNRVTAIGIATWGVIQNKNKLTDERCMGSWPARYRIEKEQNRSECFLDPNHSHFILVDNGTQHKFAVEIPFRAKLEQAIAKMKTDTGDDAVLIPVVLLVLEGGPGTLETTHEALRNNTPVVLVKGSGRAADILCYALENSTVEEKEVSNKKGVKEKRSDTLLEPAVKVAIADMIKQNLQMDKDQEKYLTIIFECLQKRDLLTVFELDSKQSSRDIDISILKALLKANKNQVMDQLKLALAWNRIDVAKSEIFTDDKQWPTGSLDDIMLSAIQLNRVDFVDLFLDNGVSLREFLTKKRLLQLYNNIPQNNLLYSELKKAKAKFQSKDKRTKYFSLNDVGHLIQELMGDFYLPRYLHFAKYRYLDVQLLLEGKSAPSVSQGLLGAAAVATDFGDHTPINDTQEKDVREHTPDFPNAAQELFLWSVLMNRQEMAELFWKEGMDSIAAALVGYSLLKAMIARTDDTELAKRIQCQAEEFNNYAIAVLCECYGSDEKKAQNLLIRELEYWGHTTCILIAVEANNREFISQTACQSLLTRIWYGKLSQENKTWRLLTCVLCPPLLLTLMKFEKRYRRVERQAAITPLNQQNKVSSKELQNPDVDETPVLQKSTRQHYTMFQKIFHFYDAPVVKFIHNVMSYVIFLALYSYILVVSLQPTWSIEEYFLIFWVFTIFTEEIRQVVTSSSTSIIAKLQSYLTDTWNVVDVVTIVLFSLGMILRALPYTDTMEAARVILGLNLVSFFFRILHIFSVHKELGPKLVMIGRMVRDLTFFVIILMVFIVSYAIAAYAILFPNSKLEWALIKNILRRPYWNLYGELSLNEIEDAVDCTYNETLYNAGTMDRCPSAVGMVVVPIMMGVYMLMCNILLLNLLIAMFSYTFQKIQDNTDMHWYFQRYSLFHEYYSRPLLAPPIIVISHASLLIHYIGRQCCKDCYKRPKASTAFRRNFPNERELIQWENVIADTYFTRSEVNKLETVEHKVKTTSMRIETLVSKVEEIQEQQPIAPSSGPVAMYHSPIAKMPPQLEKRLGSLEEQMAVTYQALDWIIQSLKEHNLGAAALPPIIPDMKKKLKEEQRKLEKQQDHEREIVQKMIKKQIEIHTHCRISPYPGSSTPRFPVPDEKVPWDITYPDYEPVRYTSPEVEGKPSWADSLDLLNLPLGSRDAMHFNRYDKEAKVDRQSHHGVYRVENGLPVNPRGRTGIIGQGLLGHWGPNHTGDQIVTRWKLDEGRNKVKENFQPVLEFVAVQRSDNKMWAIPGGFCDPGTDVSNVLQAEFNEEALGDLMKDENYKKKNLNKLKDLFATGEKIYKGYVDDPRNTDNAWIETVCVNYHDEEGSTLHPFRLKAGSSNDAATWQTVSSKFTVYGTHSYFLSLVAKKHGAAF